MVTGWTSTPRVLVVDDERLLRWAVAETLRGAGHDVREAGTAREAIEIASHDSAVDVILLA